MNQITHHQMMKIFALFLEETRKGAPDHIFAVCTTFLVRYWSIECTLFAQTICTFFSPHLKFSWQKRKIVTRTFIFSQVPR